MKHYFSKGKYFTDSSSNEARVLWNQVLAGQETVEAVRDLIQVTARQEKRLRRGSDQRHVELALAFRRAVLVEFERLVWQNQLEREAVVKPHPTAADDANLPIRDEGLAPI